MQMTNNTGNYKYPTIINHRAVNTYREEKKSLGYFSEHSGKA